MTRIVSAPLGNLLVLPTVPAAIAVAAEPVTPRSGRALYRDYVNSGFEWDVTMSGPMPGAAIRF